jgi:nucleoside-diphosphate-sugar epimerase
LITGVNGFVGRALARGMQQGEHEVIGFSRTLPTDCHDLKINWIQGDLINEIHLNEGIDYIVHCAAIQNCQSLSVREFIDANLKMTENVARYGKKMGVKGLIFTSSISLHGEIRGNIVNINTDRINPSPYGLSKYLCELVLQEYQEYFPVVALRLCGVVGRGARNIWLSRVLALAECGEDITIYNSDMPFNNILHTYDLLGFLSLLLERGFNGFSAFPIASVEPISIREVVDEVVKGLSSNSRIIDKGSFENSFIISSEFASSHFGYIPSPVRDSLRKYLQSSR